MEYNIPNDTLPIHPAKILICQVKLILLNNFY